MSLTRESTKAEYAHLVLENGCELLPQFLELGFACINIGLGAGYVGPVPTVMVAAEISARSVMV
jgi:hypothetical protein